MKRIILFRPLEKIGDTRKILKAFGYEVLFLPMIEIKERRTKNAIAFLKSVKDGKMDFTIFTSEIGVRIAERIALENGFKISDAKTKFFAIGRKTASALKKIGVKKPLIPDEFSTEGLIRALKKYELRNKRIGIIRSTKGRKKLILNLERKGAKTFELKLYSEVFPKRINENFLKKRIDYFIFTSSQIVLNFIKFLKRGKMEKEFRNLLKNAKVVAIGKPTKETLLRNKIKVDFLPKEASLVSILEMMEKIE
ncbi:MAG: uroporphyrinogen-III synthase [Candidatus Thermoplasmatota archaeon]